MAEDCTVFKYGLARRYKGVKYKDKTIVSVPGINPALIFVLPGNNKGGVS